MPVSRRLRQLCLIASLLAEIAAIVFAATAPVARLANVGPLKPKSQFDFVAFYCAGDVAGAGRSPYVDGPLADCEARVYGGPGAVLPAPIPPYVLPFYGTLARLAPERAEFVWLVTLILSALGAALLFEPLVGAPALVLLGLFVFGTGRDDFLLGQPPPIVLLAIAAAATLLTQKRYTLAALAATLGMIEPHLGLPAFAAMFVLAPRARLPLAVCAAALAAISIAVSGLAGSIDYIARVLPAHALAEAPNAYQYSTTFVLAALHVPDALSVKAGSLWYLGMVALGIALAGRIARSTGDDAAIVVIPGLTALFGGSFLHEQQLVVVVPAALLLVRYAEGYRALALGCTFAAALAWEPAYLGVPTYVTILVLLSIAACTTAKTVPLAQRMAIAVAFAAAYLVVTKIDHTLEHRTISVAAPPAVFEAEAAWARGLTEYPWGVTIRSEVGHDTLSLGHALSKLPTWLGMAGLIAIAVRTGRRDVVRTTA